MQGGGDYEVKYLARLEETCPIAHVWFQSILKAEALTVQLRDYPRQREELAENPQNRAYSGRHAAGADGQSGRQGLYLSCSILFI